MSAYVDVSFAVIATPNDVEYLPVMLQSLPHGCEVVILWNEHGPDHEVKIRESKLDTTKLPFDLREYRVEWERFSFADMRNLCGQLCTRSWIFWIDCDDTLLTFQHDFFTDTLPDYPAGVAGIKAGIVGVQPNHELSRAGEVMQRFHGEQVRLYRNRYGLQWKGHAHEQIGWSIQRAGYMLIDSGLMVIHRGYGMQSMEGMARKIRRNVELLSRQLAEEHNEPDERYLFENVLARDAGTLRFYNEILGV